MKILVIPEDFRKDRYILEPIIKSLMTSVGKPAAIVRICLDPLLGGIDQALKWDRIQEILERYKGMIDIFILCVDRDASPGRKDSLRRIEEKAHEFLGENRILLGENAWQEIEVWALAGHDLPRDWSWEAIRNERDPKEKYFLPLAQQRGLLEEPGEGRKTLGLEAARRYSRIRQLCQEDIVELERRVREFVQDRS